MEKQTWRQQHVFVRRTSTIDLCNALGEIMLLKRHRLSRSWFYRKWHLSDGPRLQMVSCSPRKLQQGSRNLQKSSSDVNWVCDSHILKVSTSLFCFRVLPNSQNASCYWSEIISFPLLFHQLALERRRKVWRKNWRRVMFGAVFFQTCCSSSRVREEFLSLSAPASSRILMYPSNRSAYSA